MMNARAIFRRKEACFEPSECEIEKVIHLSDSDFARFQQMLLDNYDFLHENAELMRVENGVTHCLLVVGETFEDGILVNSEGSDYARYAAYFPNAKSFLVTQGQTQQVVQAEAPVEAASPSAVGGVSAALLAYGERMNKIIDKAILEALECHDGSTYLLSLTEIRDANKFELFDEELFMDMLRERPEIVEMEGGDLGDILVTLSPDSIIQHDLSKMRVLTQDDVEIMYAKHILFNHDEGGEKADFSGCRLTNLDMRHMQLNGADFTGALLEDVRMNDAGLCFCTFRDAKLVGCNLNGAVAEESDFCGATFTECKLRNGIFTHSNFAHTSFQDTDLWMSDLRSCCIENSSIMDTETEGVNLSGTSEDEQGWVMGGM
ncbi:MAG: pentapeptide repeat-containing protein [Oscillospiraceae bacterium]|nr:pentapeptide repeat-containing protein [Oscillospiraceae bacterium]